MRVLVLSASALCIAIGSVWPIMYIKIYIYINMVYMCAQSPYAYWRFIFTLMTFLDLGIWSCSSRPSLGLSDLVHCISSQTKIKADELQ